MLNDRSNAGGDNGDNPRKESKGKARYNIIPILIFMYGHSISTYGTM